MCPLVDSKCEVEERVPATVTWAETPAFELRSSDEKDEDEDETPRHPHPLTAFLPPFIFTWHLTPSQKVHQPFPYNMSTSNGTIAWTVTFVLGSVFFWVQNVFLNDYRTDHLELQPTECVSVAVLYAVLLVVEFFLGICSSLYPLSYGCILRVREGRWPRMERVWGSESEGDECDDEEGEEMLVKDDEERDIRIVEYTLVGILILGAWRMVREDQERGEREALESRCDEKLKSLEDGKFRVL